MHVVWRGWTYAERLEEVLGLDVDIELAGLRVLGKIESRNLGDVLILAFTLLFLELEGDTTDRSSLYSLHEVSGVAGNLEKKREKTSVRYTYTNSFFSSLLRSP